MKVAIKQPFFMPYLGYFQVVKYVDTYIFYDDVNYYKGGYINRNNILVNGHSNLFVIPVKGASQNILINEVQLLKEDKMYKNVAKTIHMAYKKAPFFDEAFPIIEKILDSDATYVSELAQTSIMAVAEYLKFKTNFLVSSEHFHSSRGIDKEQRLIDICNELKVKTYVCDVAGKEIYKKEHFIKEGLELQFFIHKISEYKQFNNNFISHLSIIDTLMFNSIDEVNRLLDKFELE